MGENKHIEELDAFSKKYIKEIESEQPSVDFTSNIMNTILETENSEIYKHVPLITKRGWFILLAILTLSIFYVSKGKSIQLMKFPKIDLKIIPKIKTINLLENISISNVTLYACFFFTVLIFIQINFLKSRFEKSLNS